MLRAHLISINDEEHIMVISLHHIAADGWSIAILLKELVYLYAFYTGNRPSLLQPPGLQYSDYAIWQRKHLKGELLDEKLSYWKEKLEGVASQQLPADYPRPAVQSISGASMLFIIDRKISEGLHKLNQQQGATLFMTLLATFKVLLYRYSGQSDICVGSAIANRTRQEFEELIGFFVNTLALRSIVNGDDSFIELLQQLKKTTIEAYEHQEVPFEKVVEAVVKKRDLGRNPLFQVMLVLQNTLDIPELRLGQLTLSREFYAHNTSKFDLTFSITETVPGLEVVVEYRTDLYRKETIERMLIHFTELLSSVIKEPEQKIGRLSLLTPGEKQQLLHEYSGTTFAHPKDKTLVHLFEEQVAKTPVSVAVVFEDEQVTYRELNERSNQLAHYLRSKGVKGEVLVPVCVERNVGMIVAIMGILKAGGAYVPIDPEYPKERISYMLKDTQAHILVCSKESRPHEQILPHTDIIELDTDWPVISLQPVVNPRTDIAGHNLAYVIYTSGSTGKPKGVMIEHNSIVDKLLTEAQLLKADHSTITCLTTNYIFDASLLEILLPVILGGKMVIPSKHIIFSAEDLRRFLQRNGVTILQGTPGFIQYILSGEGKQELGSLQQLCIGGESLPVSLVKELKEIAPHIKLNNHYGPTESTIDAIVLKEIEELDKNIIGKPIANARIYILDDYMNPVPIGVPGEICIGGAVLARGYLNSPELSAKKFVSDPFIAGGRMYKTGDQGRWLDDGNIEFIGRKDDQIKIRGNRIELGVRAVAAAVRAPIVGMGGVCSGADAAEMIAAGAVLVAIGTENFRDPGAGSRIAAELADRYAPMS